jgi:hypothetical protein
MTARISVPLATERPFSRRRTTVVKRKCCSTVAAVRQRDNIDERGMSG